jgi:hypothetical protein
MTCRVVNLLRNPDYDVYIGRAGRGTDGYFGNPFTVAEYGHGVCIDKFREYFYERLEKDAEFKQRVLALADKTIACFCVPRRCHGDVIAEYVNSHCSKPAEQGKLFK